MENGSKNLNWSPVTYKGASFCSHYLSESNPTKLEFKPTFGMKIFYLVFLVLTIALPLFFIGGFLAGEVPFFYLLFVFAVTFLFSHICKILYRMTFSPIYFDKLTETYNAVNYSFGGMEKNIRESISSINALQILPKRVSSSKDSYTAYELNLILKSGERENIISHASYKDIKKDAEILSKHFGFKVFERDKA